MASTTRPNGGRLGLAIAALACAALTMTGVGPARAAAEPAAAITVRGYLRDTTGRFTRIEPPHATATKPGGINNRGQITGAYPSTVEQAGRTT
jgi:hypothetical protein